MIKGIVFDMDGVLGDTEHFYQKRREAFLREKDFVWDESLDFVGSNEKAIWEALVPEDEKLRQEMLMEYRAYRACHPEPYGELADPQVGPLFRALKERGIKIGIASSSELTAIDALIDAAGVRSLVDYRISGENCRAHKPDPEIYLKALEGLGVTKEHAFAVEDSSAGIEAAKNAGLQVYALKPRHGERIDQSRAAGVISSLDQVLELALV